MFVFLVVPLLKLLWSDILKFVCYPSEYFLGQKLHKNWSNVKDFLYVFRKYNLRSYTKNCEHKLDTFYRTILKSFLNICSAISFEWELQFPFFFLLLLLSFLKTSVFLVILLLTILPCDCLKFFCLSIWTFFPAKNQVKNDPLSQNLNMF